MVAAKPVRFGEPNETATNRRKSDMNKSTSGTAYLLLPALAGGVVFGLAMAIRESAGSIWMRAAVAGVGAAVGVGIALAIRRSRKK